MNRSFIKLVFLIAAGALSGVLLLTGIKYAAMPTNTFFFDCQLRIIDPALISGSDDSSADSAVTEKGIYMIRLVPMSEIMERETIAFTRDGRNMEYGIVCGIDNSDDGISFILYEGSERITVTEAEFRGIVISKPGSRHNTIKTEIQEEDAS